MKSFWENNRKYSYGTWRRRGRKLPAATGTHQERVWQTRQEIPITGTKIQQIIWFGRTFAKTKNMPTRGPRGASNKKKSQPTNQRKVTNQRGRSTSRRRTRPPTNQNGKAEDTNNDATSNNLEKQKRNRRSRSSQKKRPSNLDRNKSRQLSTQN